MTTTTPESRGLIAYSAYTRSLMQANPSRTPLSFDELPDDERDGWLNAARVLWDLATTGKATM